MALGVDVQTLYSWISRSGRNQAVIDPQNTQQPVLTQAQVDQLAHEYNRPIPGPLNNNNGINQAGMPSTPSQTFSNQVPQNNVPVASGVSQMANNMRSPEDRTQVVVSPPAQGVPQLRSARVISQRAYV